MTEGAIPTTVQQEPSQVAPVVSIQQLEQMAFGGGNSQEAPATVTEPPAQAPTNTTPEPAAVPDINTLLKENFGWDSVEAAKQEIEKLKTTPKPEFKFENEGSRAMAEAVSKMDRKTVIDILSKQEMIETFIAADVTNENAPDIIKLGLKLKYPTLKDSQIEFQYRQDYGLPKEPFIKESEDETDFQERHDEWKQRVSDIETKIAIAATMAKPDIEAAKTKIDLSSILTPSQNVDKDYEAYQASIASAEKSYKDVVIPSLTSLKEADVPLTVSLNDAGNKMQFEISIIPETADFEAARQDSLSLDLLKGCYDKDGNFLPKELQKISLLKNNFDKYAQSIARQAVNAERKRVLEEETKGGGIQRDFNTTHVEPTELQKLEKMAFG